MTRNVQAGRLFLGLPAPAKLNLFLHVVGRRADGYHELQSAFVPVDLADVIDVELRDDGRIERSGDLASETDRDLCVRAARALQSASRTTFGASIHVVKRIPVGSGMGGGSSDAATTLIALNRLWGLGWTRARLAEIALRIGADVPFFLGPGPAFVEGIGERLTPLPEGAGNTLPYNAVIWPQVSVSTAEIFNDPGLTRHTKLTTISAFSAARDSAFGVNDLQAVVERRVPEVAAALVYLGRYGRARMTGSGSAVFAGFETEQAARDAIAYVPSKWSAWVVRTLKEHPLSAW